MVGGGGSGLEVSVRGGWCAGSGRFGDEVLGGSGGSAERDSVLFVAGEVDVSKQAEGRRSRP